MRFRVIVTVHEFKFVDSDVVVIGTVSSELLFLLFPDVQLTDYIFVILVSPVNVTNQARKVRNNTLGPSA